MMRTAFSETQARFSYRNVTVTMQEQEAAEATEEELRRELTQHYGLVAARFCGLPPSLVDAAQQLLPSIQVKTLRCDRWEGERGEHGGAEEQLRRRAGGREGHVRGRRGPDAVSARRVREEVGFLPVFPPARRSSRRWRSAGRSWNTSVASVPSSRC